MTRKEMIVKIEEMWKQEGEMMADVAKRIRAVEEEGFKQVEPIMIEREKLERLAFDGSTRIELIQSTGKDPVTGKTALQMMQDVLTSLGNSASGAPF